MHHEKSKLQANTFKFELYQMDDDFRFLNLFRHNFRLFAVSKNIENDHENGMFHAVLELYSNDREY